MEINSGKSQTMHEKLSFPLKIPSENATLRISSHLLKKSLIENFIFCVVKDLNRSIPYLHSEMEGLFLSKEMILTTGHSKQNRLECRIQLQFLQKVVLESLRI